MSTTQGFKDSWAEIILSPVISALIAAFVSMLYQLGGWYVALFIFLVFLINLGGILGLIQSFLGSITYTIGWIIGSLYMFFNTNLITVFGLAINLILPIGILIYKIYTFFQNPEEN